MTILKAYPISLVNAGPEWEAFLKLPTIIQKINQYLWVPPLDDQERLQLSPSTNPFFKHADYQAFLCEKDGVIVGRVLATIDYELTQKGVGHFGHFESIFDQDVVSSLLAKAEAWFKERGILEIHGPLNFTIFNQYRLMTKGHTLSPYVGEPRNPGYYVPLIENCGYERLKSWQSWDLTNSHVRTYADHLRTKRGQPGEANPKIKFVACHLNNLHLEWDEIFPLWNQLIREDYGYSQINLPEFLFSQAVLQTLIKSNCLYKALDENQKVVGFILAHANLYHEFLKVNGDMSKVNLLKNTHPQQFVLHKMLMVPKLRNQEIETEFLQLFIRQRLEAGLSSLATSPTALDELGPFESLFPPTREYSIFRKLL